MEQTRSSGWVDRWKKLIKFRQQADPGNQGLHVQCQQTIAAVTYNQMADLTNGVRQLEQQLRMAMADLANRVHQLEQQLRMATADLTNRVHQLEQQLRMAMADLTNRVRQLEQQLRMAMAELTNRVRQLEQQLRMTLVDLTNRVRRLEEKGEEEELASHMKNLNLKWNWFYWGCAPPPTFADILRAFKV